MIFYVFAQQHRRNEAQGGEREGRRRMKHHKIEVTYSCRRIIDKIKSYVVSEVVKTYLCPLIAVFICVS